MEHFQGGDADVD
jgi:hypothetical protein